MPGTLMYECCAHTLRVMVQRMGWIIDRPDVRYEPVQGVEATLKCRGPVTPATRRVVYDVDIKEIGYGPQPFVIADANMYADGHHIVRFSDMSLQLTGATRSEIEAFWKKRQSSSPSAAPAVFFTRERLEEFATGRLRRLRRTLRTFRHGALHRAPARSPFPLRGSHHRGRAAALGGQTRRVDRSGVRCPAGGLVRCRRAHRRCSLLHSTRDGLAALRLAGSLHGLALKAKMHCISAISEASALSTARSPPMRAPCGLGPA